MLYYVSGHNGFLGSYLVKELDKPTFIPHKKLFTVKLKPYDYFYFLSTYGNLSDQTEVDKIIQANLSDLIHVLNETHPSFKCFVFLSTSSVKLRVQTMYSRTKKAAEELLLAYMEYYNLPVCIIRPFSITGVGEQPQHLIPMLIRATRTGETIDFVPDAVHDYIDVTDVVVGIVALASNQARGIFELGSGRQYTNQEVLNLVEKITTKKIKTNIVGRIREYDNQNWVSQNWRARRYGWKPVKTLEDSIKEMVNDFK